ncbi:MAG: 16S rRNA (cytidine(1402)-2'-O)-methyltransferase [Candidatus Dojkabacteria bacterium]|jgi:16S rRNA (cytidine1402-2'-O)-methyltransferase|nr:16S rRNA (cytidine(1402)-2'-O)-methyltransferase [Candidatus Dojkabacteria bacterium]MDD4561081.1 16S rRNA (cytidine(1402)-2'-O)-methyltransferase [Candidatus Dojkabacteria bacterium]NLB11937.1 16S rRNA (cytidine(1402)-2'-O)-methyltransferase [Candidatus Dojkabacteria bacterium]
MIKGKLYVVGTPIGNLSDITFRAVSILKKVHFVLAEDTRESKKLLDKYKINTELISYRDQNHSKILEKIVEKLDMGLDLALISDSGTPLISDPGYKLVRYLREKEYDVIALPGPSALVSALSVSGLPTDRFVFLGFLPKSDSKRRKILEEYKDLRNTIIIYESPNRLFKLLNLLKEELGKDVVISLSKDISKLRERYLFGEVVNIIDILEDEGFEENPHGEFVCIVYPGKL